MATPSTTQALVLKQRPVGLIKPTDFAVESRPVPELEEGQALVEVALYSLDPTHRGWASAGEGYMPAVELGTPMRCIVAGKVIASKDAKLPVGAWATGLATLSEHVVVSSGAGFMAFPAAPASRDELYRNMSVASFVIGLTAYGSVEKILQPEAGQTVLVSGAAGAVGSLVGQLSKARGARVIGVAGSEEKCKALVDRFGFDAAINYKTEDVSARLAELAPDGINAYHDNVGGAVTDAAIVNMAVYGKIAVCGLISVYNNTDRGAVLNHFERVLMRRLTIRGYLCGEFIPDMGKFHALLGPLVASGKVKYDVDVREGGIAAYTEHINSLFDGSNTGKLMLISPTCGGL